MTRLGSSTTNDIDSGTRRRSLLAGVWSLGSAALSVSTGRTSATPDTSDSGSQPGDGPFTDPGGLEAFVDDVYINMRPAGSLSATATDMATLMSTYLGNGVVGNTRILSPETADTMHSRHPAVTNWRYGFHEYGDLDANLIAHSGATVNFTSYLLLAPDHDVGILVAYNTNPSEPPKAVVDEIVTEYDLQPTRLRRLRPRTQAVRNASKPSPASIASRISPRAVPSKW